MQETKQYNNPCPVCRSQRFHAYKLGLVQCDTCDIVLSSAIWEPQANRQLEEEWFGESYQPGTSFWVALFEKWNNHKTHARLKKIQLQGRRLLEIGVGSGSFLNSARQQGYDVMGCDLSPFICAYVQRTYGIAMHSGILADLDGDNCFDVIVMNHILEHVHQPIEFMQDVYRLLAMDGIVHVAVPNIACWEAMLSGWTSYEPYHLSYFTPNTLARTVKAGGFAISSLQTHDSFSGWFLAILRTLLGVNRSGEVITRSATAVAGSGSKRRSGTVEHLYRLAMVCAGGLLWPIRFVQGRLGKGDEVIAILRKQSVTQDN